MCRLSFYLVMVLNIGLMQCSFSLLPKGETPTQEDPCSFDYTPCYCSNNTNQGLQVICSVASEQDYLEIKGVFNRSTILDHTAVYFNIDSSGINFPADLLAGKRAEILHLTCWNETYSLGAVELSTFHSSSKLTKKVVINNCNLEQFQFGFLADFDALTELFVTNSLLSTFHSMPYLSSLEHVTVVNCQGFNVWYAPSQTPNLTWVDIGSSSIDELTVDAILDTLSGFKRLAHLHLYYDGLTKVPPSIPKLPSSLDHLIISFNPVTSLEAGSLRIASRLRNLDMFNMLLERVEPGAFEGNFSSTKIDLSSNMLTKFAYPVFQPLLESMVNHSGAVNIALNPIAYDCGLAWIVVYNRHLLPYVTGQIANGTDFAQLNPNELAVNCQNSSFVQYH